MAARNRTMTSTLVAMLNDVVNVDVGRHLASYRQVDATTHVGYLRVSGDLREDLRFDVGLSPDDRKVRFVGKGLLPANPECAPLYMLHRFSSESARFDGVAFRQDSKGAVYVQQVLYADSEGDFVFPDCVLSEFVERGVAATAYLGALGFFTNLCDAGVTRSVALSMTRDAYNTYMPLFTEYGVADFFDKNDCGDSPPGSSI